MIISWSMWASKTALCEGCHIGSEKWNNDRRFSRYFEGKSRPYHEPSFAPFTSPKKTQNIYQFLGVDPYGTPAFFVGLFARCARMHSYAVSCCYIALQPKAKQLKATSSPSYIGCFWVFSTSEREGQVGKKGFGCCPRILATVK